MTLKISCVWFWGGVVLLGAMAGMVEDSFADKPFPGQSIRTSSQDCIDTYRRTHTIGALVFNGLPASTGLKRLDVLTPAIQASDAFTALVAGQKYQSRQYALASTYKIPDSDAIRGMQAFDSGGNIYSNTEWSSGSDSFRISFNHETCSSGSKPNTLTLIFEHAASGCELWSELTKNICSALGSQQLNLWIANTAIGTIAAPELPYVQRSIDRIPNEAQRDRILISGWNWAGGNQIRRTATADDLANDTATDTLTDNILAYQASFVIKTDGTGAASCTGDAGGNCLTVSEIDPDGIALQSQNDWEVSWPYATSDVSGTSFFTDGMYGSSSEVSLNCQTTRAAITTEAE